MLALWCVFLSYPNADKALLDCLYLRDAYDACCESERSCATCPDAHKCLSVLGPTLGRFSPDASPEPAVALAVSAPPVPPDPYYSSPLTVLLKAIRQYEDRYNCTEIRVAYTECCQEERGCGNCPWMYECMKNFHFTADGLRHDPPPEPSPQPSPSPEPSSGPPVLQNAPAGMPLFAEELQWILSLVEHRQWRNGFRAEIANLDAGLVVMDSETSRATDV